MWKNVLAATEVQGSVLPQETKSSRLLVGRFHSALNSLLEMLEGDGSRSSLTSFPALEGLL